ncbi:hypothetical protein NIES2098_37980 [Calothrix sp. NIES-2098]|nr:hypothetical protein NIES2098_37980 [Calothrix sp. NIES-2098]
MTNVDECRDELSNIDAINSCSKAFKSAVWKHWSRLSLKPGRTISILCLDYDYLISRIRFKDKAYSRIILLKRSRN